jgi:hypothetical protein
VREIEEEKKIDNALTRAAYGVRYAGNNDVSGPSMCYSAKFSYAFSITHDAALIFLFLAFSSAFSRFNKLMAHWSSGLFDSKTIYYNNNYCTTIT